MSRYIDTLPFGSPERQIWVAGEEEEEPTPPQEWEDIYEYGDEPSY